MAAVVPGSPIPCCGTRYETIPASDPTAASQVRPVTARRSLLHSARTRHPNRSRRILAALASQPMPVRPVINGQTELPGRPAMSSMLLVKVIASARGRTTAEPFRQTNSTPGARTLQRSSRLEQNNIQSTPPGSCPCHDMYAYSRVNELQAISMPQTGRGRGAVADDIQEVVFVQLKRVGPYSFPRCCVCVCV